MISNNNKKIGDPFYKSRDWMRVRHQILKRDGYTCSTCHTTFTSRDLQVDHIIPRSKAPHLAYYAGNLRTLCRKCHTRAPTSMGRGSDYKERPFVSLDGFPQDSEWNK
jgi:5-methylcytosine-specific restriction endonuclease McrA